MSRRFNRTWCPSCGRTPQECFSKPCPKARAETRINARPAPLPVCPRCSRTLETCLDYDATGCEGVLLPPSLRA